jgi:rhodanese-related sulfurtransferase
MQFPIDHTAMRTAILQTLLRILAVLAFVTATSATSAAEYTLINVHQAQAMARLGAVLIDVREPQEYAEGHAPGSLLVPLGQLKNRVNEFRVFEDKPVILICRSGARSARAADMLAQLGFKYVHNVEGGMLAWEKAGLPVLKR